MVLSFLHGMLLPRLSVLNLQGCLIYHNVIPQNIVSDQGTRVTAKVRWWVHVHGTHWSFHIPTNLKQLLEGSFEVLQHHISGNTLLARNKVCQKALQSLNQCPIYDIVSPIARIHRSKDQEVEMEVVSLTNPSVPLVKCLLPVPEQFIFCWPRGLIYRVRNAYTGKSNNDSLIQKLRLPHSHFELHMLSSFLFPPFGMGVPLLCLLHHCILKAHNIFEFTDSQLESKLPLNELYLEFSVQFSSVMSDSL